MKKVDVSKREAIINAILAEKASESFSGSAHCSNCGHCVSTF